MQTSHHTPERAGMDGRCWFICSVQGKERYFPVNITTHNLNLLISETHSSNRVIFIENEIWAFSYANFPFHIQMLHTFQDMFTEFSHISK